MSVNVLVRNRAPVAILRQQAMIKFIDPGTVRKIVISASKFFVAPTAAGDNTVRLVKLNPGNASPQNTFLTWLLKKNSDYAVMGRVQQGRPILLSIKPFLNGSFVAFAPSSFTILLKYASGLNPSYAVLAMRRNEIQAILLSQAFQMKHLGSGL